MNMKNINNIMDKADEIELTHSFQNACSDK